MFRSLEYPISLPTFTETDKDFMKVVNADCHVAAVTHDSLRKLHLAGFNL